LPTCLPNKQGYYKDIVEFFFDGRNECKNFWKKCVENHGFFRCQAVQSIPRRKTRVRLINLPFVKGYSELLMSHFRLHFRYYLGEALFGKLNSSNNFKYSYIHYIILFIYFELSLSSPKHSYSGKTQKQIIEFVRENYVKRQTFQRYENFFQTNIRSHLIFITSIYVNIILIFLSYQNYYDASYVAINTYCI